MAETRDIPLDPTTQDFSGSFGIKQIDTNAISAPTGTGITPADEILKGTVGGSTGTTDPTATGGTDISQQLSNIVQTGTAAPQPVSDPTGPQATLVNPDTGERRAVSVGSQDAQQLFGQGFVLEGAGGQPAGVQAPGTSAQASGTESAATGGASLESTIQQSPQGPDRISFLQGEANRVRGEAFSAVYGHTPDEWQDLPPGTQRFLRNQRVQNLARQLGNFNSAIQTVKEEMKTTRETALENLNLAMQFGVVDQMDDATLATLQASTGLSADVIRSFGSQPEPPELRSVGGNLYAIQYNPETGAFESQLVIGGGGSGPSRSGPSGPPGPSDLSGGLEPSPSEWQVYNRMLSGDEKNPTKEERAIFDKVSGFVAANTITETSTQEVPLGFGIKQIGGPGATGMRTTTTTTTPGQVGAPTGGGGTGDLLDQMIAEAMADLQ